jgi:hypothetical protein
MIPWTTAPISSTMMSQDPIPSLLHKAHTEICNHQETTTSILDTNTTIDFSEHIPYFHSYRTVKKKRGCWTI